MRSRRSECDKTRWVSETEKRRGKKGESKKRKGERWVWFVGEKVRCVEKEKRSWFFHKGYFGVYENKGMT